MVAWLSTSLGSNGRSDASAAQRRAVAQVLEAFPDAVFVVDLGDRWLPSWDAGDAVDLLLASMADCPTLVSPPLFV
jgi:hypothetical protein